MIISESTRDHLTLKFETEDLGEIQVEGKEKPIRIFRVICDALPFNRSGSRCNPVLPRPGHVLTNPDGRSAASPSHR